MSSPVITDGDTLTFDKMFGDRKVTPVGAQSLAASGHARVAGKRVCIAGDEKRVSIAAKYNTPSYPGQGSGKITISKLGDDQLALYSRSGERLMIKGSQFIAQFTPDIPAQHPQTGPDPNKAPTPGSGKINNSQSFVKAK